MPEPTFYLFDGYNLLHAGGHADVRELVDELASFVAMNGARGVVVFDGVGEEVDVGPLSVRYAPDADTLLERLAADHRHTESVCLVSSDLAVRGTSGQEVRKVASSTFLRELVSPDPRRGRGLAAARPHRPGDPGGSSNGCAAGSSERCPASAGAGVSAPRASPALPAEAWHGTRTPVLITVQDLQWGCNACKKVLRSPSTSG